ncbi:autotransporter outer membrane beta-barrel domain-containing protein [Ochrobactrum pseudogrignonense]|nr:autotransporter outer membrane beta-barrel domain-containing protein [Brucella pseudogrignonensis]
MGFELKNGTQVVGGNGTLLQAAAGSTTMLAADGNVVLSGDMVVESNDAVIDASLSNSSIWTGAGKGVTSVAVDSTSYWLMSGSSDVGALTNDGTIEFDSATPYKALTVGSLTMDNGSFVLNTKLNEGGAASETDKIVVTGDTTGLGVVNVRNNGGIGPSPEPAQRTVSRLLKLVVKAMPSSNSVRRQSSASMIISFARPMDRTGICRPMARMLLSRQSALRMSIARLSLPSIPARVRDTLSISFRDITLLLLQPRTMF